MTVCKHCGNMASDPRKARIAKIRLLVLDMLSTERMTPRMVAKRLGESDTLITGMLQQMKAYGVLQHAVLRLDGDAARRNYYWLEDEQP